MRVLHLTDVHLTPPNRSLEEVWHGPAAVLVKHSFDFIVISGDLTLHAKQGEFDRLRSFLHEDLLQYLHKKDPVRIIMVPGNHDVDWAQDIGAPVSISRALERSDVLEKEIKEYQKRPELSDLRLILSRYGHLELFRIDPDRYPARLHAVQDFFDAFYDGALKRGANRPFDLRSKDEGEHWSAHVFAEDRVAFYGFSSVGRNDRWWHGASLSPQAVYRARQHADEHARGLLRVATWHHGFLGDRGRPDHLNIQDLGLLYNAGFRVGFHGHTHRSAIETFDALFRDRMVLVSTGSLGAGPPERPDTVGNQFSIVRLYPGQVDVEQFDREGTTGTFRAHPERRRLYLFRADERRVGQTSRCGQLERTWRVGADGVARVSVAMTQLRLHGELALAVIPPPFWYVKHDDHAGTPRGNLPVARGDLADGRARFTLSGEDGLYKKCAWQYAVANAAALDQADLELRERRADWQQPSLKDGHDGRSYIVLYPCEKLTLSVIYDGVRPGDPAVATGSARAIVDRRHDEGGHERWIREPAEERRCVVTDTHRGAELTVEAPVLGCRYTLAYKLARRGRTPGRDAVSVAQVVVEKCRDAPPTDGALVAALTQSVGDASEKVLGGPLGREGAWQAFMWHQARKQLLPAFGRFANRSWAARFPAGYGVAGDAFRFARAIAWDAQDPGRRALLHPRSMEVYAAGGREYRWIAAVPILSAPQGPAIGVVSFASARTDGLAEETLRDFADDATRGETDRWDKFGLELSHAASRAFWSTLAQGEWLSDRRKQAAKLVARAFD
jgi:predicted phosphodiesterase